VCCKAGGGGGGGLKEAEKNLSKKYNIQENLKNKKLKN
jgi:hypothetical protein